MDVLDFLSSLLVSLLLGCCAMNFFWRHRFVVSLALYMLAVAVRLVVCFFIVFISHTEFYTHVDVLVM